MLHTQTAEIAKFDANERRAYEQSSNAYRDIKNGMDTAKKEGREEASKIIAKNLKDIGMSTGQIAQVTGLSVEDIEAL